MTNEIKPKTSLQFTSAASMKKVFAVLGFFALIFAVKWVSRQNPPQPVQPVVPAVADASSAQADAPTPTTAAFSLTAYQEALITRENARRAHPEAYKSEWVIAKETIVSDDPEMKKVMDAETIVITLRGSAMAAGIDVSTGEAYPPARAERLRREIRESGKAFWGTGNGPIPATPTVDEESKRLEEKAQEFIQGAPAKGVPAALEPAVVKGEGAVRR